MNKQDILEILFKVALKHSLAGNTKGVMVVDEIFDMIEELEKKG